MSAGAHQRIKVAAERPLDDLENPDQNALLDFEDEDSPGCFENLLEKPWLLIIIGVATLVALFLLLWACGVFSFTGNKSDAPPGKRLDGNHTQNHNTSYPEKNSAATDSSAETKSWFGSLSKKWNELPTWKYAVCVVPILIGCGMVYKYANGQPLTDGKVGEHDKKVGEHDKKVGEHDEKVGEHDENENENEEQDQSADKQTEDNPTTVWDYFPVFDYASYGHYVKPVAAILTTACTGFGIYKKCKLPSCFSKSPSVDVPKKDRYFEHGFGVYRTDSGDEVAIKKTLDGKYQMRYLNKEEWDEKTAEDINNCGLTASSNPEVYDQIKKGQSIMCRVSTKSEPFQAIVVTNTRFFQFNKKVKTDWLKVKTSNWWWFSKEVLVPMKLVHDVKNAWTVNETYRTDEKLHTVKSFLTTNKNKFRLDAWKERKNYIKDHLRAVYTDHTTKEGETLRDNDVFSKKVLSVWNKNEEFKTLNGKCNAQQCPGCIIIAHKDGWRRCQFLSKKAFEEFWEAHKNSPKLTRSKGGKVRQRLKTYGKSQKGKQSSATKRSVPARKHL